MQRQVLVSRPSMANPSSDAGRRGQLVADIKFVEGGANIMITLTDPQTKDSHTFPLYGIGEYRIAQGPSSENNRAWLDSLIGEDTYLAEQSGIDIRRYVPVGVFRKMIEKKKYWQNKWRALQQAIIAIETDAKG